MLRARPCRWFELVTTRDDLAAVLDALACAGAVELQTHERRAAPLVIAGVDAALERFRALALVWHAHWPAPRDVPAAPITDPAATLAARLAQLEAWRGDAEPLIGERERLVAQLTTLDDVAALLAAGAPLLAEPALLGADAGLVVEPRVYALPHAAHGTDGPVEALQLVIAGAREDFFVVVGRSADLAQLDDRFAARKARRIAWPMNLSGDAQRASAEVGARRAALEGRCAAVDARLLELAARHELSDALADIALIEWLARHGSELSASDRLAWVTGWTPARDADLLSAPVQGRGLRCLVQFPGTPPGSEPPTVFANPPWARAFEAFARLLGQPGRNEADPSRLVAFIAPLLFGFMFGDVGQGALLVIAGLRLRRRIPMLALLIPGGVAAMAFGLLFGTVFAREDLITPLWLHPLAEPVAVLAAALALGAAILLGGLALGALQAHWRGEAPRWWARDAGLALAYLGVLGAPFARDALWLVPAGALWWVLGTALVERARAIAALGTGAAEFVEKALQLAVNTVSFARVGAFALAHAGLSVAVTGLADAAGGAAYWIVLAAGNALIVALEGLVVAIQTTRLLLFEFFIRFLQAKGRAFRPLAPPRHQDHATTGIATP